MLLKQGENGSITIKHTAENQEGPRQRKGIKGRKLYFTPEKSIVTSDKSALDLSKVYLK